MALNAGCEGSTLIHRYVFFVCVCFQFNQQNTCWVCILVIEPPTKKCYYKDHSGRDESAVVSLDPPFETYDYYEHTQYDFDIAPANIRNSVSFLLEPVELFHEFRPEVLPTHIFSNLAKAASIMCLVRSGGGASSNF